MFFNPWSAESDWAKMILRGCFPDINNLNWDPVFCLCEATNRYVVSSHYLLMWKEEFTTLESPSLSTFPLWVFQSGSRSSLWRQQPFPQNTVCIPETLSNPCKQHSCFRKQKPQKNPLSHCPIQKSPLCVFVLLSLSYANEWHLFFLAFPVFSWQVWL